METALMVCIIGMIITNVGLLYLLYRRNKPAEEKPQETVEAPTELTDEEKIEQAKRQKLFDAGIDNLLNYQPKRGGSE